MSCSRNLPSRSQSLVDSISHAAAQRRRTACQTGKIGRSLVAFVERYGGTCSRRCFYLATGHLAPTNGRVALSNLEQIPITKIWLAGMGHQFRGRGRPPKWLTIYIEEAVENHAVPRHNTTTTHSDDAPAPTRWSISGCGGLHRVPEPAVFPSRRMKPGPPIARPPPSCGRGRRRSHVRGRGRQPGQLRALCEQYGIRLPTASGSPSDSRGLWRSTEWPRAAGDGAAAWPIPPRLTHLKWK